MSKWTFSVRNTEHLKTFSSEFELARDTHAFFDDVKDLITESHKIGIPPKPFEVMALASACQIELTYITVVRSLSEGHWNDCMALLRGAVEHVLHVAYMKTNKKELGEQWLRYAHAFKIKRAKLASKIEADDDVGKALHVALNYYLDNKADIDEFAYAKSKELSDPLAKKYYANWTRLSVRDLADKTGLLWLYDTVFAYSCDFVHPSPEAWNRHLKFSDGDEFEGFQPNLTLSPSEAGEVISAAVFCLIHIAEILLDHTEIPYPEAHEQLVKRVNELILSLIDSSS